MDITPAVPEGRILVDSYGPGRFKIRGEAYTGSVILMPDRVIPWGVTDPTDLSAESLSPIQDLVPRAEIILLGTGPSMAHIPVAVRRSFREAGYAVDIMDTGAACRTFNVLMVEGRRAVAALIAI